MPASSTGMLADPVILDAGPLADDIADGVD
jgi:hypothetical protein